MEPVATAVNKLSESTSTVLVKVLSVLYNRASE